MFPHLLKISGKIRRHDESKYDIIMLSSQYIISNFFLFSGKTDYIQYCNHNNSAFKTSYHTKTYQNAYKLTWPLNTNLLIFKSWSKKSMLWWHGMLMHIFLDIFMHPSLALQASNKITSKDEQICHFQSHCKILSIVIFYRWDYCLYKLQKYDQVHVNSQFSTSLSNSLDDLLHYFCMPGNKTE
jgi:hypothetical protein